MNPIETLRKQLRNRFPAGKFTISSPVRTEDLWTLDIDHGALHFVVEWLPPARFGVSAVSDASGFGGGPDEMFSSIEDTSSRLVILLTTSQRPSPPLPALLARVREDRGVSQAQLAKKLGLTQATVSGYERRHDIQVSTLNKIVVALGGELRIHAVFADASYTVAGETERSDPPAQQEPPSEGSHSATAFSFPTLERNGGLAKAQTITAKVASRPGGLLAPAA